MTIALAPAPSDESMVMEAIAARALLNLCLWRQLRRAMEILLGISWCPRQKLKWGGGPLDALVEALSGGARGDGILPMRGATV